MSAQLDRAILLYQQAKYDLADKELRQVLTADPINAVAHALLSFCLLQREDYLQATEEAKTAIHYRPDLSFCHYALANVLYRRNRLDDAIVALSEAIRLDPKYVDAFYLLAAIRMDQSLWNETLLASNQGLTIDPEHVGCRNFRAIALNKLGRKSEARTELEATLAKAPENALTHASQGWAVLEDGNHKEALVHFREALRLNPESDWAKEGLIQALKARHLVFGIVLRYFFWMSKFNRRKQWLIVLGIAIGYPVLFTLVGSFDFLSMMAPPLMLIPLLFVFLTWTADPLFNLLLRLNRFGRYALSREQIVASNWIGGCLLAAAIVGTIGIATKDRFGLFTMLVLGVTVLPLSATFKCQPGWPRTVMSTYTVVMAAFGVLWVFLLTHTSLGAAGSNIFVTILARAFFIGLFLHGWVANWLIEIRPVK